MIVDIGANDRLDITSAEMLTGLVHTMHSGGVDLVLVDVRQPVTDMARRAGLIERLWERRVFRTIDAAIQAFGTGAGSPRGSAPVGVG